MHNPNSTRRTLKPHARLTQEQAVAIFRVKAAAPSAVSIAACFNISDKAVRDIWTARTWSRETSHLDPTRTVELKQIGRPKGCRDSKPRKKRADSKRTVSQGDAPNQCVDSNNDEGHSCCFTRQGPYESNIGLAQINQSNLNLDLGGAHYALSSSGKCSGYAVASTSRVTSVDDQLYEWDEKLWKNLQNTDPFFNAW